MIQGLMYVCRVGEDLVVDGGYCRVHEIFCAAVHYHGIPDVADTLLGQFVIQHLDESVEPVEWFLISEHLVALTSLHQYHDVGGFEYLLLFQHHVSSFLEDPLHSVVSRVFAPEEEMR